MSNPGPNPSPGVRRHLGLPPDPNPSPAKPSHPVDLSCIHRGPEVRQEQCQSCGGVVYAKIMACEIHRECTLFAKPIAGVKACRGCADRQARIESVTN